MGDDEFLRRRQRQLGLEEQNKRARQEARSKELIEKLRNLSVEL